MILQPSKPSMSFLERYLAGVAKVVSLLNLGFRRFKVGSPFLALTHFLVVTHLR